MKAPLPVIVLALATLAAGALGAILLTEAGQVLNLPREWVFTYYHWRAEISVALVIATLALIVLHFRAGTGNNWLAGPPCT